jgi:hypothetical protein
MDAKAVSEQIDKILGSRSFANKAQLRKLLQILHQNINSQTVLKADHVIEELWPTETRTKRSGDVAAEITRLRNALKAYYADEGADDPVTIALPTRAVSAINGTHSRQWIVARPRDSKQDATEQNDSSVPQELPTGNFRKAVVITSLCAVFGVVAYFCIRIPMMHARPNSARLDGNLLQVRDANGKELWSKSFPEGFGPAWFYSQGLTAHIWFGDLEGKGRTSVLFVYSSAANPLHSSTLICYSDNGEEKWRWTPGRDLPELGGSPPTFKTFAFDVLKATDKSSPRILVSSAHDTWWQNQIALLDANGKVISEYWHSGRLDSITLADLDGDGKEEIIAAGVNNGYHQATLVVLDADRVFGASTEARADFQIHGMGAPQEKLRLLFPRSDLNQALFAYNLAVNPLVENGSIRVTVRECIAPPGCLVWYEFDKDIRLTNVYAGPEFRSAHGQFYQRGTKAHSLSSVEEARFGRVRCLVGCKAEFVAIRDQATQTADQ